LRNPPLSAIAIERGREGQSKAEASHAPWGERRVERERKRLTNVLSFIDSLSLSLWIQTHRSIDSLLSEWPTAHAHSLHPSGPFSGSLNGRVGARV
jgi:hypothetical protein